jgi:hypothetical protein
MSLPAGEPAAGSWQAVRTSELMRLVATAARVPGGRPRVLAVDGRGGSEKSTLAERLRREATRSALLHTDDLAWYEQLFGWGPAGPDARAAAPRRAGAVPAAGVGPARAPGSDRSPCRSGPGNRRSTALNAPARLTGCSRPLRRCHVCRPRRPCTARTGFSAARLWSRARPRASAGRPTGLPHMPPTGSSGLPWR